MNALGPVRNPLPLGRYEVDLWTPTQQAPSVRDGVPIFNRWREANAQRVRVLHAECWNTEPRQTRVLFEVAASPGAWPFAQLGTPEPARSDVGALSFADVVSFLFDPLGTVELSAAQAAGHFLADVAAPELQQLRAAISVTQANIAIVRATLEAVRNGTVHDPKEAIAASLNLIQQSIEMLVQAGGSVAIAFPRHIVNTLLQDLHNLKQAIHDAPGKALAALGKVATDAIIPFEVANMGGAVLLAGIAYVLWSGKRTKTTDNVLLVGAAALVLGGGTLISNIFSHPKAAS